MDSVILDADKISKGKSKWGEDNKVYTRRSKTTTNNAAVAVAVPVSATATTTTTSSPTPTATVTATSPPTTVNNGQTQPTEPSNPENRQTLSPQALTSDDRPVQPPTENGVVKPVISLVDGRVRINLCSAKSKNEIIELMETMKTQLEQVRHVVQRLEDKEAELTAISTAVVAADVEPYNHLQYSGDDTVDRRALLRVNSEMGAGFADRRALMRINSEVGSVTNSYTNSDVTPFRRLSVSVMNNSHGIGEFVEKEKRTPKANQYYRNSDFLLGKDRLPVETNKRRKSNSGRKHSKDSDYGRNQMFKNCNNLLQRLMKHKFGWVFNEPVNAKQLGLHDYHDIIKHPMDLGTIKSRLAQNFYKSPMEFAEDVRLTFHNAMTYNPKGQDVYYMAEQLSDIFEEKWGAIESEYNRDMRYGMIYDANTPTPTSRKVPHFAHVPSRMLYRSESLNLPVLTRQKPVVLTRTPVPKKPKAKDPNKRNMTYEEKQKLSTNLQSLPSEKLDSIVQIIKKNTSLSQHDDEIEVDIDSVDIETLWELDRFVTNYKKNLSKHKRKAALAQQARVEAGDVNRAVNLSTSIPEVPKENNTNEKTLANEGGRGDNASSSSSSSSDSGSSSSDSDSDSSSEDGSDAGHSPRN